MFISSSGCWTQTVSPCSARGFILTRHGVFCTTRKGDARTAASRSQSGFPPHDLPRGSEIETAIHAHFAAETADAGYELRETLRRGGYSLLLALLVVASLVMFAEWLQVLGQGRLYKYLGESLIIIGWVTLWTPIELLMFDHFPIRRRRNLARALARSRIVLETR